MCSGRYGERPRPKDGGGDDGDVAVQKFDWDGRVKRGSGDGCERGDKDERVPSESVSGWYKSKALDKGYCSRGWYMFSELWWDSCGDIGGEDEA